MLWGISKLKLEGPFDVPNNTEIDGDDEGEDLVLKINDSLENGTLGTWIEPTLQLLKICYSRVLSKTVFNDSNCIECSQTLNSLSNLKYVHSKSSEVLDKFEELGCGKQQEISNVLWCISVLEVYNEDVVNHALKFLKDDKWRGELKTSELCIILYSLANIFKFNGRFYGEEFKVILEEIFKRGRREIKGFEVANVGWSLGTVGVKEERFERLVDESTLTQMGSLEFQNLVWGISKSFPPSPP
ncbi:hypothetical protein TL16_g02845 [Triparma laevis f. inornata]|uniref:Uncharacterized protein n=1 Tax=Triparma laevis f. inornata TaxID=1714386 RepID=A0A9W6ZW67_9STRA|nr:hypothetical protein TL16_g02845 [Triparma laevis f. inornata]